MVEIATSNTIITTTALVMDPTAVRTDFVHVRMVIQVVWVITRCVKLEIVDAYIRVMATRVL